MQQPTIIKEKTPRGQPAVQPATTETPAQFRTARQADDITPAPSTSQLHSDSDDTLASQFVRILQRNPAADIPLIKQLTDELSQLAAVKEQPEVEVPLNAVTTRKREPTVAERLLALVRRRDPNQYFSRADDLELQLAAVPVQDRPLLALLQKLTVALNPEYIFDLKHLGAHDYLQVDAYLRSDIHRSLRSYITKEVYLPEWSDAEKSRYPQCAVLLVVQNVKGIKAQCHSLQEFLAQLANAPVLNFGSSLFENIMTIQSLVYNITARQAAVHNQFWPQAFRKDDQPRLADQLAQYGLHFPDIHDALALATATVAEAQQVLANLSQQHLERLLIIQDDEIFAATEQAPPQTRSSGAGAKRQSQSPTFSEEIDKLAKTADLRPTPLPLGDIPMDEPQQVMHVAQVPQSSAVQQHFLHAVAAEEVVSAQVAAPVAVPAQVAARPTAPMQAVAAPLAAAQPVRIPLERAVSPDIEDVRDPRIVYRQRNFTPPRYQYEPQFQEEQEHVVPSCFFCHGYHYSSGCHVVINLSARLYIHAQRGRCFKCGEEHDERNCRLRRKCRACQSLRHHTAFCKYNNHVRVDFPEHEFYDRLEEAMAQAREVRMRRRAAQFQDY